MEHQVRLNQLISNVYEDVVNICKSKYGGAKCIYGVQFEDLMQQAVERLLNAMIRMEEDEDTKILPRLTGGYVRNSLVSNFQESVGMARRGREIRDRPSNQNWIKEQYYPDNKSEHDFEEVEVRNLYKVLGGKTRAFIRMLERDGLSVREVARKLDISTWQFYKAQKNIQALLRKHGYEKTDQGEGYRSY